MLKLIRVKSEHWAIKTREVLLLQSHTSTRPKATQQNRGKPPPECIDHTLSGQLELLSPPLVSQMAIN